MGSSFSTIGSISSNIGAAASGTPTSSIQLTPALTEEQVIRLTRAAERYWNTPFCELNFCIQSDSIFFLIH